MTSAIAPFVPSYGVTTPYLTVEEYANAPTAMDVSNLIAGGNADAQTIALQETIGRASSWIDGYVTNSAYNTLCATLNTENARVWGNRQGQLIVHPKLWPILEIQSFNYSTLGSGVGSASIEPNGNIWIEPQQFVVQPTGVVGWGVNQPVGIVTNEYFCQWQYVNGFPNTTTTASVAAGASSVTVFSGLGIYPGTQLTLFDAPYDESVTVAPNFIPDTSVVPLVTPLQYDHESDVTLTNLPKAVKQAAILATTSFIKQRGSGALIVEDIGEVTRTQTGFSQNSGSDLDQAMSLLSRLRQMFVGY